MNVKLLLPTIILCQAICTANAETPATASPTPPSSPKPQANLAPKIAWPRYKPPIKDAPAARQDGGTRGPTDPMPALFVLTPNHVALTTQEQPSLYWFQSQPTKVRFELTVTEPNHPRPLLALKAEEASKAGIRRIKLADHNLALKVGVEYRWSIALVPDPNSHSRDVVASGSIKRVEPSQELRAKLDQAAPAERAALYAQGGFWYDALQSLSEQIDAHPDDHLLHAQRAALLEQVKLPQAAVFDRKEAKDR